jgi:hypothetical protein
LLNRVDIPSKLTKLIQLRRQLDSARALFLLVKQREQAKGICYQAAVDMAADSISTSSVTVDRNRFCLDSLARILNRQQESFDKLVTSFLFKKDSLLRASALDLEQFEPYSLSIPQLSDERQLRSLIDSCLATSDSTEATLQASSLERLKQTANMSTPPRTSSRVHKPTFALLSDWGNRMDKLEARSVTYTATFSPVDSPHRIRIKAHHHRGTLHPQPLSAPVAKRKLASSRDGDVFNTFSNGVVCGEDEISSERIVIRLQADLRRGRRCWRVVSSLASMPETHSLADHAGASSFISEVSNQPKRRRKHQLELVTPRVDPMMLGPEYRRMEVVLALDQSSDTWYEASVQGLSVVDQHKTLKPWKQSVELDLTKASSAYRYLIHFCGWNKRFDVWLPPSCIRDKPEKPASAASIDT